jgi:CRP/FNR family transcriptional regulator, cyclic AMP receptor protein
MERSRVAAIRFFADLPAADLASVASLAFEVEVASGQALTAQEGPGHTLFAIESGTADVIIDGTTVQTVGAGDVVGEIAVFAAPPDPFAPPEEAEGGVRTASVIATSPVRMIVLYKRDVWTLDERAPVAAQRLRAKLEQNRAALEQFRRDQQQGRTEADPASDRI